MSLRIHPALRALGVVLGGLALLVLGSLAAVKGLSALAQAGMAPPPAPAPPAPVQGADPAATMERARLLARQSHGDWTRLSAEDQRLLNGVTGGHGREMLRAQAAHAQAADKPRRKE